MFIFANATFVAHSFGAAAVVLFVKFKPSAHTVPLLPPATRRTRPCSPNMWSFAFFPLACGVGLQPPPGPVKKTISKNKVKSSVAADVRPTPEEAQDQEVQVSEPRSSASSVTASSVTVATGQPDDAEVEAEKNQRFVKATTLEPLDAHGSATAEQGLSLALRPKCLQELVWTARQDCACVLSMWRDVKSKLVLLLFDLWPRFITSTLRQPVRLNHNNRWSANVCKASATRSFLCVHTRETYAVPRLDRFQFERQSETQRGSIRCSDIALLRGMFVWFFMFLLPAFPMRPCTGCIFSEKPNKTI